MRKNVSPFPLAAAAGSLLALMQAEALAAEPSTDQISKFAKELNDLAMFDYSEYYLKKLLDSNTQDSEKLKILLADTYVQSNKIADAEELIKSIPKTNIFYASAQAQLGMAFARKGRIDNAISLLEGYIKIVKEKRPDTKEGQDELQIAIEYLKKLYNAKGTPDKIKALTELESGDQREKNYYAITAALDGIEKMFEAEKSNPEPAKKYAQARKDRMALYKQKAAGKPIDEKKLAPDKFDANDWQAFTFNSLRGLEEIVWGGQDVVSAYSYVAMARCYYMIGDYDNGIKTISLSEELYNACDEEFAKQKQLYLSPGAGAAFWLAKLTMGKAASTVEPKDKEELYIDAVKKFMKYMKKYDGANDVEKAYSDTLTCIDELKKLGKTVKLPANFQPPKRHVADTAAQKEDAPSIVPPDAEQLFNDKKYDKVIQILFPLVKKNRANPGAVDAIYKLGFALASTGSELEGLALTMYLADLAPKNQITPIALLQCAQILWDKKQKDDAILLYEKYLATNPEHQFAPDIAYRIAKEYYDRAAAIAAEANKISDPEKKQKKSDEAYGAYKMAVPKFQRVINEYKQKADVLYSSYYMQALCYTSSKMYPEAAEIYVKFAEAAEEPLKLADAKLRAGDSYYQGGQNFEKLAKQAKEEAAEQPAMADVEAKTDESGEKTKGGKQADAERYTANAKESYNNAVEQLKELVAWYADPAKLGSNKDAKLQKLEQTAQQLLAMSYDSAGDKKSAATEFQKFISKYPSAESLPGAMMKLGTIYTELGDDKNAETTLHKLIAQFPNSNEGKNAQFFLGRSLFNMGNYKKSVEVLEKMYARVKDKKDDNTVQNMRWVAGNLYNCGGEHPKDAAELALKASEFLLKEIEKPKMEDWVGKPKANELKANPAAEKNMLAGLKDRVLFDAANSAYWANDYKKALVYFDQLMNSQTNPFALEALFTRADIYIKQKDYEKARKDLGDLSFRATTFNKTSSYARANCLIGDTYLAENNQPQAFAAFSIIANTPLGEEDAKMADLREISLADKEKAEKEKADAMEWVEYALFKAAQTAAKTGKAEDRAKYIEKYLKNFPSGQFTQEINKIPAAASAAPVKK